MQTPTEAPRKPSDSRNVAAEIVTALAASGHHVAVAESCTGGLLAAAITAVSGASHVFPGGIISYSDEVKASVLGVPECLLRQHGAVSAEVAAAMAAAVAEKCGADYGLATTGFAGPGGGTPEDPSGTVYIGFHSATGLWADRTVFSGDRDAVREQAVLRALTLFAEELRRVSP